jgi:hypothetical protein
MLYCFDSGLLMALFDLMNSLLSVAWPVFSLPLSEVHGHDPDIILIEEIRESCVNMTVRR